MNKTSKLILSVILPILLAVNILSPIPVSADNAEYVGLVVGIDSDGEAVTASAGVALRFADRINVIFETDRFVESDIESIMFAVDDEVYVLECDDSSYYIDSSDNTPAFLNLAVPEEGDAYLAYYNIDAEYALCDVTIENITGAKTGLSYEISGDYENVLYPAAVLNSDADCVGVMLSDEIVLATWADSETSGSGSGSSVTSGGSESKSSSESGLMKDIISGAAIGAAAAAVIAVVNASKKRKKDTDGKNAGNNNMSNPGGGIAGGGFEDEIFTAPENNDPFVTTDISGNDGGVSSAPEAPSGITLIGIGGVMDARTYHFDNSEITIGRDVKSNIRYPADTKGISRVHCKLFMFDGKLMLMDLGSTYGTSIDGYGKLTPHVPMPVTSGTMFCVGDQRNKFRIG